MLENFTPRLYQQTILATAAAHNTLVVLPTGLGKTAIALLLATHRLKLYSQSKILMLAPTKPLCDQHATTFKEHLSNYPITIFTGSIPPIKREQLWKTHTIIISTPQGLENDIINQRINLQEVSLLIFDEAHHATGDYSYVWLAQQYEKNAHSSRILALTASPGSDLETIKEVCQNLHIERVEVRTPQDQDVKPYVQDIDILWEKVEFPKECKKIQELLVTCKKQKLSQIMQLGYAKSTSLTKGDLLALQIELQKNATGSERSFDALKSLSLLAEALKIEHALDLLETQGPTQLQTYLLKLQQESATSKVKAVKNLVQDELFKAALFQIQETTKNKLQNPKLERLKEIILPVLHQNRETKIIIFTQFRESAEIIVQTLTEQNIKTQLFVGQAKKNGTGLSQKEQKEILQNFRNIEFNVLVATSVAEEGLDIPKVDHVIFYEPIPSAIRSIQRRGRTGRLSQGSVIVLLTQGTRDETYRWASHHKEKRMHTTLTSLKKEFTLKPPEKKEVTLDNYLPPEKHVLIVADHREKDNKVVKELIDEGISVKTAQLESADYILSGRVGIELKKVPDFVGSIIDGRIFEQLNALSKNFEKAILVIEGEEDIYTARNVHPNAIRGMLASVALDFNVSLLYSKNPKDTAQLLATMAKREQDRGRDISLPDRKPKTFSEQQEFIIASFPTIGLTSARKLLEHFGTIHNIMNATKEQLTKVESIGEKGAQTIIKYREETYKK